MNDVLIDPATIRSVLFDAEKGGLRATATKYGFHHSQIYRWRRLRRERSWIVMTEAGFVSHLWPTDQDIIEWHMKNIHLADKRARSRTRGQRYRRRRYLNGGPILIPGTGSARRLQALLALGWTETELSSRLNVAPQRVSTLVNGLQQKVTPEKAKQISDLYERLSMTVPRDYKGVRKRGRNHARARGWVPPLAWDDIDDPNEKPARCTQRGRPSTDVDWATIERRLAGDRTAPMTEAERAAIVEEAFARGWSLRMIQDITGIGKPERYHHKGTAA